MSELDDFAEAVRTLHREKDRAYGPSWKRRGELLSILPNIARKVDRVEHSMQVEETTRDETAIDTAVDLVVYGLKYQTFLADVDDDIAAAKFSDAVSAPYSDGTAGFEALLARLDMSPIFGAGGPQPAEAARAVVECFAGVDGWTAISVQAAERVSCAVGLTGAAVTLLGALRRAQPNAFSAFVAQWLEGN